jgi:hypothetical protein
MTIDANSCPSSRYAVQVRNDELRDDRLRLWEARHQQRDVDDRSGLVRFREIEGRLRNPQQLTEVRHQEGLEQHCIPEVSTRYSFQRLTILFELGAVVGALTSDCETVRSAARSDRAASTSSSE